MRHKLLILVLVNFAHLAFAQQMETTSYRDMSIPYIELNTDYYNFDFPILSSMLNSPSSTPPDFLYLKSDYGHRYLSSRSVKTDNHGGFDYWPDHLYNGVYYDEDNKIDIVSMCDGVISEIINGTDQEMEQIPEGRSVQVKCDQQSQIFQDIKINYRHLHSLGSIATHAEGQSLNTVQISKGDIIGKIGESGSTSNVHLHLSFESTHPEHANAHLNTARLFNPNNNQNIIAPLTNATISLIHTWDNNALFRIIWPYNQTINRFEFINDAFRIVFDKEAAYEVGSGTRDHHDAIEGIQVFAYQFNGKQTASSRYENEKMNIPAIYPASPQRDADLNTYIFNHYPITEDQISHVYDFIVEDLPNGFKNEDFIVKLSDVWGYTVEGILSLLNTDQDLKKTLKVFPNPVNDIMNLTFQDDEKKSLELFSTSGKRVLYEKVYSDKHQLHVNHLSGGIYFLKVKQDNLIHSLKIIKE